MVPQVTSLQGEQGSGGVIEVWRNLNGWAGADGSSWIELDAAYGHRTGCPISEQHLSAHRHAEVHSEVMDLPSWCDGRVQSARGGEA